MLNLPDRNLAARLMPVMLIGGLVATIAAALLLFLAGRSQQQDQNYRAHVAELTVIAGAMPAQAAAAGRGEEAAFGQLGESTERLERVLADIDGGQSAFDSLSSESAKRIGDSSGWTEMLEGAKRDDDGIERFPAACRFARAAVDDQIVGALGHVRIEVVHQHAERGFLRPSFAGQRCAARRSDESRGCVHRTNVLEGTAERRIEIKKSA